MSAGGLVLVDDLLDIGFPHEERGAEGIVVVLEAYFDESFQGTGDHRLATIAGYVSHADAWKKFNRDWRGEVLHQFKVNVFHMADCENGYGEFDGWTREKRVEICKVAMPIMANRTRFGIAVSVVVSDLQNVTNHGARTWGHPYLQSPYAFCFFAVLQGLTREIDRFIVSQKPIALYFDRKKGVAHETQRHFEDFRRSFLCTGTDGYGVSLMLTMLTSSRFRRRTCWPTRDQSTHTTGSMSLRDFANGNPCRSFAWQGIRD